MKTFEIITMGSAGRVVIPPSVQKTLFIDKGTKLLVFGSGNQVVLKKIESPGTQELKALLKETRRLARVKKIKKSDIRMAIQSYRKNH